MSSTIDSRFLTDLLAFPADTLDKKTIQFIFDMCKGKLSSSSSASSSADEKPKKTRKSKSKDDSKENDENKPKRKLNDKLAARNSYWKVKKDEGMSYKDFNALWKSMTDDEKKVITEKYSGNSTSSSNENSDNESKNNSDIDEDQLLSDIQAELNEMADDEEEKKQPEPKKVEKKQASNKAKKSVKK
jgi:hypothetical protein